MVDTAEAPLFWLVRLNITFSIASTGRGWQPIFEPLPTSAVLAYNQAMDYQEREHILHKIIAVSAFLGALCSLPVLQYALVTSQIPTAQNQVAGAATTITPTPTPQTKVQADIPAFDPSASPVTETDYCTRLEEYRTGTQKGFYTAYENKVKPYEDALAALQGTPEYIQQETNALNSLIAPFNQDYQQKLAGLQTAVASDEKTHNCLPAAN